MLLLLNMNLFASLLEDGVTAYNQGDVKLANKLYLKACQKRKHQRMSQIRASLLYRYRWYNNRIL